VHNKHRVRDYEESGRVLFGDGREGAVEIVGAAGLQKLKVDSYGQERTSQEQSARNRAGRSPTH